MHGVTTKIMCNHFSEAWNVSNDGRTFSSNEERWQVVVPRNLKVISVRQRNLIVYYCSTAIQKPYLFTEIMEYERNQPHLMEPESKWSESDQHSSRRVGEASMRVIYLVLVAQNQSNKGWNNALQLVVTKGENPAHWGAWTWKSYCVWKG